MKANIIAAQKQTMSAFLRRSLELFQLPFDELQQFVQEQIDTNPFLKIPESSGFMSDQEPKTAEHVSLYDFLIKQVVGWKQKDLAIYLIGLLDQDGYFREPLEALEEKFKIKDLDSFIKKLQTLDPVGVFARNLQECYAIQLKDRGEWSPEWENFLEHIHLPHQKLIKLFGKDNVHEYLKYLRQLSAFPGEDFKDLSDQSIIPDITAVYENEEWLCYLNSYINPLVEVDHHYKDCMNQFKKEEKEKMKTYLQSARWLPNTLSRRAEMLKNVTLCILEHQTEFFLKGNKGLKPLTLKAIAEQLDVHESTISRIIKYKYVQTERGTFPLKFFFNQALQANIYSWDNKKMSAYHIQDHVRDLIENEPHQAPYSDQKLIEILKEKGIIIARRTITKYRMQNNIPSASKRKGLYLMK